MLRHARQPAAYEATLLFVSNFYFAALPLGGFFEPIESIVECACRLTRPPAELGLFVPQLKPVFSYFPICGEVVLVIHLNGFRVVHYLVIGIDILARAICLNIDIFFDILDFSFHSPIEPLGVALFAQVHEDGELLWLLCRIGGINAIACRQVDQLAPDIRHDISEAVEIEFVVPECDDESVVVLFLSGIPIAE